MGCGAAWSPSLWGGASTDKVLAFRKTGTEPPERCSRKDCGKRWRRCKAVGLEADAFLPGRGSKVEPSGAARRFYVDASGGEAPVLKSC